MGITKVSGRNITCRWFEKERDRESVFPAAALELDGASGPILSLEGLNAFLAGVPTPETSVQLLHEADSKTSAH